VKSTGFFTSVQARSQGDKSPPHQKILQFSKVFQGKKFFAYKIFETPPLKNFWLRPCF